MIVLVLITLCLVSGALSSLLCPRKFNPELTVHLAHPIDCGKFLTCVGSHPVEQSCPSGLHWNEEQGFCDYPRASNCSRGDAAKEAQFNLTTISHSQQCLPQTARCPVNSKPREEVVFVKHRNCRKFYACVSAQPIELSCPYQLYWNSKSCICDYDVDDECNEDGDRIEDDVEEAQPEDGDADEEQEQEEEQPKEDEAEQSQSEANASSSESTAVRVRRAADNSGSGANSGGSGSAANSGSSGSGSNANTGPGSGSNPGSNSGSSSGSGSAPVQSGADIHTVSSIAVLLFTVTMSVL
ncbi:peritrophin-1-like [Sabethes cyaneus]|uniref:peritrophin-1-like n=1 Tax=Sabethes cyaneus TaxID=53552 RepID=UPI00237EDBF9|nr:peritrophin-1-like [Sabethes cyaneus]